MENVARSRLGEILVQANLITPDQLQEAIAFQERTGLRIGAALIQLGYASEDDVAWALADQLRIPYVHVSPEMVDPAAAELLPQDLLERHQVFPVLASSDELTLVMADPTDAEAIAEIERVTGLRVVPAIDLQSNIRRLIERSGRIRRPRAGLDSALTEVRFHLSAAAQAGAQEVYFEPYFGGVRVRYRTPVSLVDGPGPRIDRSTLARLADEHGPLVLQIPLPDRTVAARLQAVSTAQGHAVFAWLEAEAPPLAALGIDPATLCALEAAVLGGGIVLVGSPDGAFRRLLLRSLAARVGRNPGIRTVAAGLKSPRPLEGVLELESAKDLWGTQAEVTFVDLGTDLGTARSLCRAVRPGTALVLGVPDLRVSWALEALRPGGRLVLGHTLAGALCGATVPALCACALVHDGPPEGWPVEPSPVRWGSPVGCDRCRNTGFLGQVAVYEWYRPGPNREDVLCAPAATMHRRLLDMLSPSLETCARSVVEALRAEPRSVARLLGSLWG